MSPSDTLRLSEAVSFRRDLLFSGAVQLGWLESNPELAAKAAAAYAFHGPAYHGVVGRGADDTGSPLMDTASFTRDLVERVAGLKADEPFVLAIAGYGTGKSHLGVTLASLLSAPDGEVARGILANLTSADTAVGDSVTATLRDLKKPCLVVALNGMKDFDLAGEIVRQVIWALKQRGLDTAPLDDLRPRFKNAIRYTRSFYQALKPEFEAEFGVAEQDEILDRLEQQNEEAYARVSAIWERKTGEPIRAIGQESLQDFIRVTNQYYCGENKPYAGMLILFDEFGRYLEFAVQKPQQAGPGAVQQLFEAVQANAEGVYLLGLMQFEPRAYFARVAPELRNDLERYVGRYDIVKKVRLSCHLETLLANLLEKTDATRLREGVVAGRKSEPQLHGELRKWFPTIERLGVWSDQQNFERVVREGCWPLHPAATWTLTHLSSVGTSLQQRSAFALLDEAYSAVMDCHKPIGYTLAAVDLCTDTLVEEFAGSERWGQVGAAASAYRNAITKYGHQLSEAEVRVLKSVLLAIKLNARTESRSDCIACMGRLCGSRPEAVTEAVRVLESERGALRWDEAGRRFEIAHDAVPRAELLAYLQDQVVHTGAAERATLFANNVARWYPELAEIQTSFALAHDVSTREWRYAVSFTDVGLLEAQIRLAFSSWAEAQGVDEARGQLIYCYVGPESNLRTVEGQARMALQRALRESGVDWDTGCPVGVALLDDEKGAFGAAVAEYHALLNIEPQQKARFAGLIADHELRLKQILDRMFEALRTEAQLVWATGLAIEGTALTRALTNAFEQIYSELIPFPFDGFTSTSGNAAADCGSFTREMFLGHVDRSWIAGLGVRQKGRAHQLFAKSWELLADDGAIRQLPGNPTLQKAMERLEQPLNGEPVESLNLGSAQRMLCAPPFGCNSASAGLVIAYLFSGGRNGTLELQLRSQRIDAARWVADALPRNTIDVRVLDQTEVRRVPTEVRGEWERLLNAWEVQKTHAGKIAYLRKARELEKSMEVPQPQHYMYENLCRTAGQSLQAVSAYKERLDEAVGKLQMGEESRDAGIMSWGAALLAELRNEHERNAEQWTPGEIRELEEWAAKGRLAARDLLTEWLPRQKPESMLKLEGWLKRMGKIAGNLQTLGLREEAAALEDRARIVEGNIRYIEQTEALVRDVQSLATNSLVTDSTSMRDLSLLLERSSEFAARIREAQLRKVPVVAGALISAHSALCELDRRCQQQIKQHKERLGHIYEEADEAVSVTLADIRKWRAEVTACEMLFAGRDDDLSDLAQAGIQLDRLERDYARLSSPELDGDAYEALLVQCLDDTREYFGVNEPPLDEERLYDGIAATIRESRRREAEAWIQANVPEQTAVSSFDANNAYSTRSRLLTRPALLASEQHGMVERCIAACEFRIDELEVEGMVTRYEALSEQNRRVFLSKIGAMPTKEPGLPM